MPLINVPEAEEPIEVPADAIEIQDDEDLVFQTQEEYNSNIQSRLNRARRSERSDLESDEEFVQEAMRNLYGVELREDGRPKGSPQDDELEELRRKASKVETLEEKVSTYEQQIEETRKTRAWSKIQEHAPDVREGASEDVRAAAFRRMEYDDELGWVAKDDEGSVRYENGKPVGIEGVTEEIATEKEYLFKSTEMKGGPSDDPGSAAPTGDTLTRDQFDKEREKARESGDVDRLKELRQKAAEDKIID